MSGVFSYSLVVLLTLSFFLISYLSYKSNPVNKINKTFSALAILIGLWNAFSFLIDEPLGILTSEIFLKLDFSLGALIATLFLLFSLNFPKQNNILTRVRIEPLVVAVGVIFAVLSLTNLVVSNIRFEEGFTQYDDGNLSSFYYLFLIVFFGISILNLLVKQRNYNGVEKLQARFVLLGLALSASSAILFDIVLPIFEANPSPIVTRFAIYGTSFLVGFTAYAIIKHRLLDIEVIIRRSVIYSTLLASLIVLYSVLVFGFNRLFLPTGGAAFPRITDLIAIIIVAFTVDPLRKFIEKSTDRIFFKARYDAQETVKNISETITEVLDFEKLVNSLRLTLNHTLKVNKIAIYAKTDHHFEPIDKYGGFGENLNLKVEKQYFLSEFFKDNQSLVVIEEWNRALKEGKVDKKEFKNSIEFLQKNGVAVVIPLVVKDQLTGAIFLGEKLSGDIFSNEDLKLLEIFSHQASIALENARLYQEQKKFSEKLQTEVEKATADLRKANERLKELDKAKDEFVSVVSHELRTPMTAIKSYVWMALNGRAGKLNTKMKDYLGRVYLSSERLIGLINDVLDVSHIETGRIDVDLQPVSPVKVAEDVLATLAPRAKESEIELRLEKDSPVPMIAADPMKLNEIYVNLIGNALKFTPKKGKITVSFAKQGKDVEISVTDTGIGIEAEDLKKLFTKFGRITKSFATLAQSTGSGLGLYITKNYLELMNGKIWVNSEVGKGTTFTFSLPTAASQNIKHKSNEKKVEVVSGHNVSQKS